MKSAGQRALRAEDRGVRHPRLRHRPGGSPQHKPKRGLTVNFTPSKRLDVGVLSRKAWGQVALLARRLRRRRAWPLVGPEADVPQRLKADARVDLLKLGQACCDVLGGAGGQPRF